MRVEIWTDGACWPNPGGTATYGFVVVAPGSHVDGYSAGGLVLRGEGATNNVAEWGAVEHALAWLLTARIPGLSHVSLRMDSLMVANQMNGKWACKKQHLADARNRCKTLIRRLGVSGDVEWRPRAENVGADAVAAKAYKGIVGKPIPVFPAKR